MEAIHPIELFYNHGKLSDVEVFKKARSPQERRPCSFALSEIAGHER